MSESRERLPTVNGLDEDATGRLLRLAGPRPSAPVARHARVRLAVHRHWQARRRRAVVRRRAVAASIVLAAAAIVLIAGRVSVNDMPVTPRADFAAVVDRIDGIPRRIQSMPQEPARLLDLAAGDPIPAGEWIETDGQARAGLRFANGTSVRLDVDTRARPLSSTAMELASGAVYVDTGSESGRFEVKTAMATARDIGTQFEVRLIDRAVRLRVRTGAVELTDDKRSVSGRDGTEIMLTDKGAVSQPIAAHGSPWEWTTRVAPRLEIEGMVLATFLERMAREHGWALQYGDPTLSAQAAGITLHGSVNNLSPREALDVAIVTSNLQHRLEDGELVVLRRSSEK